MFTKKLKLLLVLFYSIIAIEAFAQSYEQTYNFASHQIDAKNYDEAVFALKRLLFFNDSKDKYEIYKKLSFCYKEKKDLRSGLYYLDLASTCTENDSLKTELVFSKSYLYLLQNKLDYALLELYTLPKLENDYLEKKRNFHLGVIYFKKCDFDLAQQHFICSIDTVLNNDAVKIKRQFQNKRKLNNPKPKLASNLNFLPGLGDIYSGSFKNALNSFLLSGSLLLLSTQVTLTYSLFDSYITVFPWSLRYYLGNMKLASNTANNKREMNRQKVYEAILDIIAKSKN